MKATTTIPITIGGTGLLLDESLGGGDGSEMFVLSGGTEVFVFHTASAAASAEPAVTFIHFVKTAAAESAPSACAA
jgi:hypothetical protein